MSDQEAPETRQVPPPMIGSYRLVEPLGSGGMSSVFRAIHHETGLEVAVKVLPRYLAKNPTLLQRFMREAKSAESLEDPNIVAIYDRGSEAGRHYLVLEYVPGCDLHDLVRDRGPMAVADAVDAVRQVCRGLKHAASRGLIHRDIKPANILKRNDGVVKVTDLGLALQIEDEDERVTRDGTTVGTVDYMAPEQARDSRASSIRSDIYSLGCTLFFLMTGTAPFVGGDVAEKLRAHATEPPPDVRAIRPGVPAILARLIQKMMAKRPEKRFADYDKLLDTLDAVAAALAHPAAPVMAIIDDEDEDEDEEETSDEPLLAIIDDSGEEPRGGPLVALIDDSEETFELGPGPISPPGPTISTPAFSTNRPKSAGRSSKAEMSLGDVNLSELADVEEASPTLPAPKRPPSTAASPAKSRFTPSVAGPSPEDVYDLNPVIAPTPHMYQVPALSEEDRVPLTTWMIRLVLAGITCLLFGFVWTQFSPYFFDRFSSTNLDKGNDDGSGVIVGDGSGATPTVSWTEPADSAIVPPAEPPVSPPVLAKLGIEDAAKESLARNEAPFITVRRIDPVRNRENVGDLASALDNLGGTIEIADCGPFFEESLRMNGEHRVVRAAKGFRPVLVLGRPESTAAQNRPAAVILDGQSLLLEGIDLVVDAASLTARQESLFLLRNDSSLTIRDCTITVIGPVKHAYSVIQVGERGSVSKSAASRVHVERSRIRGDASALRLAGPAIAAFARSVVTCAKGEAVEIAGEAKAERSVAFFRTVVAIEGPVINLIGAAGSAEALPPIVRSLESTFAAIAGAHSPFVKLSDTPPGAPRSGSTLIDWRGEGDVFAGWEQWSSGSPAGLMIGLQGASPDIEKSSRETKIAWPSESVDPWSDEALPSPLLTTLAAPLSRVAVPLKSLQDRTLGTFAAPPFPGKVEGTTLDLKFNADDDSDNGDLGRFLASHPPKSARKVRVAVSGSGRHELSPIAMPDGVSLEITIAPVPPGSPPLSWTTPEQATGDALIEIKRGELMISGANITATPKTSLSLLISVFEGNLKLSKCVLIGPAGEESAAGGLVDFRTKGSRPFPERGSIGDRPSCVLTDCILMTGGDAISADVGSGLISLTNCAVATASNAIVLTPQRVRRDRFDADLVLDHCTLAAVENIVWLKGWTGLDPGPDRPWVVRSKECVFSDSFVRDAQAQSRGVLFRSHVDGLARGALAWQSDHDVYDLSLFLAGGDAKPLPVSRADVNRSWVDFWGPRHILGASGQTSKGELPAARFLVDKLKPSEFEPADLALDPSYPPGRKTLDVGADLKRMGVSPKITKFRPR
jgi:serine/threonine protein kinase